MPKPKINSASTTNPSCPTAGSASGQTRANQFRREDVSEAGEVREAAALGGMSILLFIMRVA
jgi:hypothetical protein